MGELLTFGQHKLCKAEAKDGDRVATLENELKVHSLLQKTAVDRHYSADQDTDDPTENKALTTTMENVSAQVNAEVKHVEKLMKAIEAQKDKNENAAAEIKERVQALISLLSMETKECRAAGQFEQPGEVPVP